MPSKDHCDQCDLVMKGRTPFEIRNSGPVDRGGLFKKEEMFGGYHARWMWCSLDCMVKWIQEKLGD